MATMAENKTITIFHVFPDEKFFDSTADFYDSLSNVENRYFFYTKNKNYKFKYIKKSDKINIVNGIFNYIKELRKKDIDIVFFHTLLGRNYFFSRLVRHKAKVIWWSWGYDIYLGRYHSTPLLNIPLYKKLTLDYIKQHESFHISLYQKIIKNNYEWIRRKAVKRVDYFIPSIPIDYDLMIEQCPFFHAKPFPYGLIRQDIPFHYRKQCGNILVGNSLTYTNNHLDIFETLYSIDFDANRKIVVPISYGDAFSGADKFIALTHFSDDRVIWLKDFLSREKYFELFDNISHAVFGMMRQQGMGNVMYCLRTGKKVFLYKDSVISRQLNDLGYIFYTIEDDLDSSSLSSCLSQDEAKHNYQIYMSRYNHRSLEDVQNKLYEVMNIQ
ncbi:MAG: TDP-N-acetylfucosamine:lipid II N-acetylfucosaminyltransferase [Bacteroidales bacterium]|nr:TDP-N-acetylfucosamine:lipid II N-acetylfucosaminyltransferase [Bacteroidales bacterium]